MKDAQHRVDEKAEEIINDLRKHFEAGYRKRLVAQLQAYSDRIWRQGDPGRSFTVQDLAAKIEAGGFDGE